MTQRNESLRRIKHKLEDNIKMDMDCSNVPQNRDNKPDFVRKVINIRTNQQTKPNDQPANQSTNQIKKTTKPTNPPNEPTKPTDRPTDRPHGAESFFKS
jgi:hypothetical protein